MSNKKKRYSMQEKIQNVIDALNVLMTDDVISNQPHTVGKLNTMKRYLLVLKNKTNN